MPGIVRCGGQRSVMWVAGEPGIGKTTLIEHFVSGLGGVAVARGQCVEHYGAGEPYLPVLEALAELCRNDASASALLRSVAPTWLLQLPWLSTAEEREALRRELAGVGSERMLREMGELLDRYTEQRPLLLVTEDLHWSDRPTIQLIDHVARRRSRAGLMWLATFRVAEVVATDHPLNPLRRELRLHRLCEEIVLDAFSETEVADCIAQLSPSLAGDEAFVRALHERTDGVPLFVCVGHHRGDGAHRGRRLLRWRASRRWPCPRTWRPSSTTTSTVSAASSAALLAAAAVCGVEFRVETLAQALQREHRLSGPGLRRTGPRTRMAHGAPCWRPARCDWSCPIPSSMRFSARCCTTAPRLQPVHSCTATWARPWSASAPPVWRFRLGAGDALRPRPAADGCAALVRRGGRSGAAELQPRGLHVPGRARTDPGAAGAGRAPSATRWSSRWRRCRACRPSIRSAWAPRR